MTVSTTDFIVDYTGDGVSTDFAVPFPFFGDDELRVTETVIATGAVLPGWLRKRHRAWAFAARMWLMSIVVSLSSTAMIAVVRTASFSPTSVVARS